MTRLARAVATLALVFALAPALPVAAGNAPTFEVVGGTPEGQLAGTEPERIQIFFSAPAVALGEVRPMSVPPSWLKVEPPIMARWRWAGTTELVGEPVASLPRATTYRRRTCRRPIGWPKPACAATARW